MLVTGGAGFLMSAQSRCPANDLVAKVDKRTYAGNMDSPIHGVGFVIA
jgi:dTDP-D-glucose 4,6-dehydratase